MEKENLVEAVWRLTRPGDELLARRYLEALRYLISIPKAVWFQPPFYQEFDIYEFGLWLWD